MATFWDLLPASLWPVQPFVPPFDPMQPSTWPAGALPQSNPAPPSGFGGPAWPVASVGGPRDPNLPDSGGNDMLSDAQRAHAFAMWAFGPPSAPRNPQMRAVAFNGGSPLGVAGAGGNAAAAQENPPPIQAGSVSAPPDPADADQSPALAAATGNPKIERQGARARAVASQRPPSFWGLLPASAWPTQPFIPPDEQAQALQALQALQAPASSFSPATIGPDSLTGASSARAPEPVRRASSGEDASTPALAVPRFPKAPEPPDSMADVPGVGAVPVSSAGFSGADVVRGVGDLPVIYPIQQLVRRMASGAMGNWRANEAHGGEYEAYVQQHGTMAKPGEIWAPPGGGQNVANALADMIAAPAVSLHEMMQPPPEPPNYVEVGPYGRAFVWRNGEPIPWENVEPDKAYAWYAEMDRRANFAPRMALGMLGADTPFAPRVRPAPARPAVEPSSTDVVAGVERLPDTTAPPGAVVRRPGVAPSTLAGATQYPREQADLIRNWLGIAPERFRGDIITVNPPRLAGELLDESGRPIGYIHRSISPDTGVAEHVYFELNDELQDAGLAKDILRANIAYYRQLGLSRVNVTAGLDRGGYVWARYGFVPSQGSWDALRPVLRDRLDDPSFNLTPAVRQQVLDLLEDRDPHAIWRIAGNRTPVTIEGETLPLGNRLLSGTDWEGSLDLNDAEAMDRFDKYVGPK